MANAYCTFNRQSSATLRISYRTQNSAVFGDSSFIFYRINGGPWQNIPNIYAYIGPTYVQVLSTPVFVNDVVEYYFSSSPPNRSYGLGFNGVYFGGEYIATTIITPGINDIYFNICSTVFGLDAYYCFYSPY